MDARGRAVVTYSRCRKEPPRSSHDFFVGATILPPYNQGTGCDVYEYGLRARTERRLRATRRRGRSEYLPARWGGRIVFATRIGRRGGRRPRLTGVDLRSGRTLNVAHGGGSDVAYASKTVFGPSRLDLVGSRVAVGWVSYDGRCLSDDAADRDARQLLTQVYVARLDSVARRLVASGCLLARTPSAVVGPSIDAADDSVVFGRVRGISGLEGGGARTTIRRLDPSGSVRTLRVVEPGNPVGLAADAGALYVAAFADRGTAITRYSP